MIDAEERVEAFLTHLGALCPVCESPMIEGGAITVDGPAAYQWQSCLDCDSKWRTEFELTGFDCLADNRGNRAKIGL